MANFNSDASIQYAQADPVVARQPIGHIDTTAGKVNVTHINGIIEALTSGDPVFQGDYLVTGGDAAVGIVFVDETVLSMGESSVMTLDEMVYDAEEEAGSLIFSLAKGAYTFVSGQIAKTDPDGMTFKTPSALIGIRGSAGGININDLGHTLATLFEELGKTIGELMLTTGQGTQVVNQPLLALRAIGFNAPPSSPFAITFHEIGSSFGGTMRTLPNADGHLSAGFRQVVDRFVVQHGVDDGAGPTAPSGPVVHTGILNNSSVLGNLGALGVVGDYGSVLVASIGLRSPGPVEFLNPLNILNPLNALNALDDLNPLNIVLTLNDNNTLNAMVVLENVGDTAVLINLAPAGVVEGQQLSYLGEFFYSPLFLPLLSLILPPPIMPPPPLIYDPQPPPTPPNPETFFATDTDDTTTLGIDTFHGNAANTRYVFDQGGVAVEAAGSDFHDGVSGIASITNKDQITDAGGNDIISLLNLENVTITVKEHATNSSFVTANVYAGALVTSDAFLYNTIDIAKVIEHVQASTTGSGGVFIPDALSSLTGTKVGYIVAGNDGVGTDDTIDLSGVANPIGSVIFGRTGDDTLLGTTVGDIIHGDAGSDTVFGKAGNDLIFGDAGTDFLHGDTGDDTIYGGAGNDDIYGGGGSDTMYGGSGVNTFIYTASSFGAGDMDLVNDTSDAAAGDKLEFSLMGGTLKIGGTVLTSLSVDTQLASALDVNNNIALVNNNGDMQIHFDSGSDGIVDKIFDIDDSVSTATYDFTNDYTLFA